MAKRITVADLKDQIGTAHPRPFLHCRKCGAEYSANAGDYWAWPSDEPLRHCGVNMLLVTSHRVLTEVK